MSTIRTNAILDSAGGNTATINGITPALASQAQAEAGTDNTTLMTPLRVAQATLGKRLSSSSLTDVTASRATATTYQNTSSSWRIVVATFTNNGQTLRMGPTSGGQSAIFSMNASSSSVIGLVPPGWFYSTTGTVLTAWWES